MPETRIRSGTHKAGDLNSTHAVVNFPIQADMLFGEQWLEPVIPSSAIRQYDAQVEALSGHRGGIGRYNGSIILPHCTPLMIQYLRNHLFPTDGWSEQSTIVVLDAHRGWIALNCLLQWNEPADHWKLAAPAPGYFDVKLDFVEGVEAAEGGDFNSDFSSDFFIGGVQP